MYFTAKRKIKFSNELLSTIQSKIGFVDVGSGGELKAPWCWLPGDKFIKYDFEPMGESGESLPLCISNRSGTGEFYVAKDERGSSLHEASENFIKRFGFESIRKTKTINVRLTTLDEYFKEKMSYIDCIDINAEGHDFQILQGAEEILKASLVKLIKIEFELTEVWKNQGWFSDIDGFLRERNFELANIEMEFTNPVNVSNTGLPGEPLWGKAYYVPSLSEWKYRYQSNRITKEEIVKAIVLYTLADVPGRAIDLLEQYNVLGGNENLSANDIKVKVEKTFSLYSLDRMLEILNKVFRKIG